MAPHTMTSARYGVQYLCNSLEDNIADRHREAGAASSELERMVQSSGKMVLLHKLLPKLKAEGHKVPLDTSCSPA